MASNLRRSKRTVGKRVNELNRRVTRLQKRPAPKRLAERVVVTDNIAQNTVTSVELAPGSVDTAALDSSVSNSINFAQATADGKNKIFYSDDPPSAMSTGDLWFDTKNGFALARWNGSSWVSFGLGNAAISNLDAGKITAGEISSARITSASISAASINADNITSGTITGRTIQTSNPALGQDGVRITSTGFLQGMAGAGIRVMNSDNSTGKTQLFANDIFTGKADADEFIASDGTSSMQILRSLANFRRHTDDTGAVINIFRRSWTGDSNPNNGDSRSDNAALIAFYKEGAGSSFAAMRYVAGANPASVQLQNISDARLKIEVASDKTPLEMIDALQPKYFRWRNHEEGRVSYGLYAQELYNVIPEAVYVGDREADATVNKSTGQYEVQDAWMMDYTSIVPYLIGAVQELSARVAELESK